MHHGDKLLLLTRQVRFPFRQKTTFINNKEHRSGNWAHEALILLSENQNAKHTESIVALHGQARILD